MKWISRKNLLHGFCFSKAFSLVEAVTSLTILALVSSSVLVVINRCTISAANMTLRTHAFEVARENMERILTSGTVSEMTQYGNSDKYPEIKWETTVETSDSSVSSQMVVKAVCSTKYTDTNDVEQTVELTSWVTSLTGDEKNQVTEEKQKEEGLATQEGAKDKNATGAEKKDEPVVKKDLKNSKNNLPNDLKQKYFEEILKTIKGLFKR